MIGRSIREAALSLSFLGLILTALCWLLMPAFNSQMPGLTVGCEIPLGWFVNKPDLRFTVPSINGSYWLIVVPVFVFSLAHLVLAGSRLTSTIWLSQNVPIFLFWGVITFVAGIVLPFLWVWVYPLGVGVAATLGVLFFIFTCLLTDKEVQKLEKLPLQVIVLGFFGFSVSCFYLGWGVWNMPNKIEVILLAFPAGLLISLILLLLLSPITMCLACLEHFGSAVDRMVNTEQGGKTEAPKEVTEQKPASSEEGYADDCDQSFGGE